MKNTTNTDRRRFLKTAGFAAAGLPAAMSGIQAFAGEEPAGWKPSERLLAFREIRKKPIVDQSLLPDPVIIDRIEVMQNGKHRFVRAVSKDGAVGIAAGRPDYVWHSFGIMTERVIPVLIGQDARDIEKLVDKVYLARLNYKWQGLALWMAMAYVELAVLDLLGQVAGKPMGEVLGGRVRDRVAIYYASGNRENTPEEEAVHMQGLIDASGAKAVKCRLGARMKYTDFSTKRDLGLIPTLRRELGDDVTIYTDANGSYDVPMAIRIGRMLEQYDVSFFEEPCPFDYYEETRAVADALDIRIAGGEEESSTRGMMWLLDHDVVQVIQPDLLFFGGLTRSIKVARMAAHIGIDATPHISGGALGFLYMMQFASCVPNIGPHQEFKGNKDGVPVVSGSSSLQPEEGWIDVPTDPGLGVTWDPDFLSRAKPMECAG